MVIFNFLGQELHLFPERALYWKETKTLVIADPHFGKAAAFRAYGIALPPGTTQTNLGLISAVLSQTQAERLLILGDFFHAKAGKTAEVLQQFTTWRQRWQSLAIELVVGNHDRHAGGPPTDWQFNESEERSEPPFIWRHIPSTSNEGYVIAGHIHPGVNLRGAGEHITLPCFYFGTEYGVLPAFGDFTGFGIIYPKPKEKVFVVADKEVIPL